jgi:hypothetical protein
MLLVAFGSFGTIKDWLAHGHGAITTYAVAAGLSLGLVGVAIMLSKVDFKDKTTLQWMTGAVVAVALLSGTIQSIAYYDSSICHYVNQEQICTNGTWGIVAKSMLQGYGFPLIFEGLLAYAAAMFESSQKKKREAEAADTANIDRKMDAKIHEAVSHIDLSAMQDRINEMAMTVVEKKLARAFDRINSTDSQTDNAVVKVSESVNAMVSEVVSPDSRIVNQANMVVNPDNKSVNQPVRADNTGGNNVLAGLLEVTKSVNPSVSTDKSVNAMVSELSEDLSEVSEVVNPTVSTDKSVNAMVSELSEDLSEVSEVVNPTVSTDKSVNAGVSLTDQIVNVVSEHLALGATEIHRLIGGDSVCSRGNIYNYLNSLMADGRIVKAGSKYQIAQVVAA